MGVYKKLEVGTAVRQTSPLDSQKWRHRTAELFSKEFCDFPANCAAVKLKSPGWFRQEQANIIVNALQSTVMYFLCHFFSSLHPHLPFINIYNPHHWHHFQGQDVCWPLLTTLQTAPEHADAPVPSRWHTQARREINKGESGVSQELFIMDSVWLYTER